MATLKIYKNQNEVEKTYTVDHYDLMFGTSQDIISLLDTYTENPDGTKTIDKKAVQKWTAEHRDTIAECLLWTFGDQGLTRDELNRTKAMETFLLFAEIVGLSNEEMTKN